jgi:hypothetical protein
LDCSPPIYASLVAGMTYVATILSFIGSDEVSLNFCLVWPSFMIYLASASCVVGIIDMRHCTPPLFSFE